MSNLLYEDEVFLIRGAAFEVHNEMGNGFLEAIYQDCLAKEFRRLNIPFVEYKPLALTYKGEAVGPVYKPDFVCFDKIILELKVASDIAPEHQAQLLHYLKATGLRLGLVINFGRPGKVQFVRVIL